MTTESLGSKPLARISPVNCSVDGIGCRPLEDDISDMSFSRSQKTAPATCSSSYSFLPADGSFKSNRASIHLWFSVSVVSINTDIVYTLPSIKFEYSSFHCANRSDCCSKVRSESIWSTAWRRICWRKPSASCSIQNSAQLPSSFFSFSR